MVLKNTWASGELYTSADQNDVATQVNTNTANIGSMANVVISGADPTGVAAAGTAIAAADSAATGSIPVVFPAGTYRVSANLTVTSPVVAQPGAVIKPDSGVTVTLSGGFDGPNSQVFDHSAGGLVVPKNVDFYRPQWWGPTGTANDTQAWTDMADALNASVYSAGSLIFGQRVLVPHGSNRMIGVTLSNCTIIADKNDSIFWPPSGTTSGVVLTLGDYAKLQGGYFGLSESAMAVTSIWMKGARCKVDDLIVETWTVNSVGIQVSETSNAIPTSPLLSNLHIQGAATPAAGSIGIDLQTSDSIMNNIVSAGNNIGLKMQRGSTHITNLHVWGNNTGISGTGFDACQFANVYLDSNLGWGIDVDQMKGCVFSGVFAWQNGWSISSTGAIRLRKTTGTATDTEMRGVVLSDNTGHGIKVDGPTDYDIECALSTYGSVITTTGVEVTSATTRLRLNLHGTAATTPLVDSSSTTVTPANPHLDSIRDTNGAKVIELSNTASAVNYLTVENTSSGSQYVGLYAQGSDTDISWNLYAKGAGNVNVLDSAGRIGFQVDNQAGTPVNYPFVTNNVTGAAPTFGVWGTDTNVDANFTTKGAGVLKANGFPVGVKVAVPATATSAGVVGQWAADASFHYTCTATNTWRRVAHASW